MLSLTCPANLADALEFNRPLRAFSMDAFFEARAVAKFGAVPVETLNFSKEINVLKQRGKDGNNLRG